MLSVLTLEALHAAGFKIGEGKDAYGNHYPAVRHNLPGDKVVVIDLDLLDVMDDPVAFVHAEIIAAMEGRQ